MASTHGAHSDGRSPLRFAVLLAGCCLFGLVETGAQTGPASTPQRFEERLVGGAIAWRFDVDAPGAFVASLCKDQTLGLAECFAQFDGVRRSRLATLYSLPDITSAPVAYLYLATRKGSWGATIGIDVERVRGPGQFAPWVDIGDWFYGTYIDGQIRSSGDWIQLMGPPFPVEAWLPREGQAIVVLVEDMTGRIFYVQPLKAADTNGAMITTSAGDYLVIRIGEDGVEFRAEVSTDFDCGQPGEVPSILPPLLRAPAHEFFNGDGSPRFFTKYSKGC